jgi:hypothetical protein
MLFAWTSLANFYLAFFFLVQSATTQGPDDAFNFLSVGAGQKVFEVILKVSNIRKSFMTGVNKLVFSSISLLSSSS